MQMAIDTAVQSGFNPHRGVAWSCHSLDRSQWFQFPREELGRYPRIRKRISCAYLFLFLMNCRSFLSKSSCSALLAWTINQVNAVPNAAPMAAE